MIAVEETHTVEFTTSFSTADDMRRWVVSTLELMFSPDEYAVRWSAVISAETSTETGRTLSWKADVTAEVTRVR